MEIYVQHCTIKLTFKQKHFFMAKLTRYRKTTNLTKNWLMIIIYFVKFGARPFSK